MATERLFDKDAYATEFDGTVISCTKLEDGKYDVVLDKTVFFPEEGGQTPDNGTLDDIEVLDVQIKDDVIYHTVTKEFECGTSVHGKIDWTHRFNNMQQHSGEHIFSGLVNSKFGLDNVGFHLSDDIVTMDYNGPLSMIDIKTVEKLVNKAIYENIDIQISYPDDKELSEIDYRSKKEILGQVRIVTIPGYDVCACCAPHVKKTGEIGVLKVVNLSNYKGGVRVSILCGFRALDLWDFEHDELNAIAVNMSTGTDKVRDNIDKMNSEIASLKEKLSKANQELIEFKVNEISSEKEDVIVFMEESDMNVIRRTVNALMDKHEGICGIFGGDDNSGYKYIIGSNTKDAKALLTKIQNEINIKGGGSERMVQGAVSGISKAELANILNKNGIEMD
ncbi:MAG: hypothetical protein K6B41_05490 [Butyrivibrio sp.]|nr:hypothetical protein [Butyrivibrio sp.]